MISFVNCKLTLTVALFLATVSLVFSQNPLFIPDTLSGTTFNLTAQIGTKSFFAGQTTPTYGYNGNFLGPTLILRKGDSVTLNVTNQLPVATTVHWHGFHVAPENDGGPHQVINANGGIWSPSFTVRNNAATYWYHPHGHTKTELQVSKGLAGIIIIRDNQEDAYALPRSYGVDDFPLIFQTRAFDILYQVALYALRQRHGTWSGRYCQLLSFSYNRSFVEMYALPDFPSERT